MTGYALGMTGDAPGGAFRQTRGGWVSAQLSEGTSYRGAAAFDPLSGAGGTDDYTGLGFR